MFAHTSGMRPAAAMQGSSSSNLLLCLPTSLLLHAALVCGACRHLFNRPRMRNVLEDGDSADTRLLLLEEGLAVEGELLPGLLRVAVVPRRRV